MPKPLRVAGPLASVHTWRLVAITGRVDSVRKLGERWRAEIAIGAQRLVVVAQPGARIPITALAEGRTAEVVGIVRPPYPTSTDRRPSILPRARGDVRQGPAGSVASGASGPSGRARTADPGAPATANALGGVTDADLVDLETLVDTVVRVGGLVLELRPDGFMLDDGTAIGRVIMTGPAAEWLDLIEPDDAINVSGRVARQPDGEIAVVVDDPAAIVLGGAIDGSAASAEPVTAASPTMDRSIGLRIAGFGDGAPGILGAGAGLAGLLAIGMLSLAATVIRRRHARRSLAARVAPRLAAITGANPPVGAALDRPTMT